jgi:cell division protein FtsB
VQTGQAVVLAFVLLVLALALAVPLRTYLTQRADLDAAQAEHEQLSNEISDLLAAKELRNDPAYIALQARERLRMVPPGEIPYQVQLPGEYQPPPPLDQPVEEDDLVWYEGLWRVLQRGPTRAEAPILPGEAQGGSVGLVHE